ncbi:PIG-L deacetylase family protein [Breoghania sp.]|uniref:PIG-L deacetylase family protein n=1 Tax=Breoghania sp. TaxID=2065378 RepID=UPI0039F149AA
MSQTKPTALVVSAHSADFVWRAGGAIALHAAKGYDVTIVCLSYGERGESAKLWKKEGCTLEHVKTERRKEAEAAASALGAADIQFFDIGDYPLGITDEAKFRLVDVMRKVQPKFILSHSLEDPYNTDHPAATRMTIECRMIAQAWGHNPGEKILGAPQVYLFEPHQTEQCGWKPDVLLDITEVWDRKIRRDPSACRARSTFGSTIPASPSSAGCRPSAIPVGVRQAARTWNMARATSRYFPRMVSEL